MLLVVAGIILPPISALAYDVSTAPPQTFTTDPAPLITAGTTRVCASGDPLNPSKGLTSRLIPCIKDAVIYGTTSLIKASFQFFSDALIPVFVIAFALWGIMVMTGHSQNITRDGVILGIKVGAILLFINNFGGYYPKLLDSIEGLLNILAKPAIPLLNANGGWNQMSGFTCEFGTFQNSERDIMEVWNILDCYIDMIVGGIFSTNTMATGILGFIAAALFSTTVGMFIATAGVYMLANGLMTIGKMVYIFVTAYIAFSFMIAISCIFIPCILFTHTKEYFDSWLRLTISFMLQPLFVFGYLIMFIVAINVTIFSGPYSLYYAIVGEATVTTDPSKPIVNGEPFYIGTWLNNNGAFKEQLKNKDQIRESGDKTALNEATPVTTGQTDKQGFNPLTYTDISDFMTFNPNDLTKPLSFFQAGIPMTTVDWEDLSHKARASEWATTKGIIDAVTNDEVLKKDLTDQFTRDYQVSLFITFLMAAITMYIFYSLLDYMPFIGTGTLGDTGISPTLGVGNLAAPGSGFFGGGR